MRGVGGRGRRRNPSGEEDDEEEASARKDCCTDDDDGSLLSRGGRRFDDCVFMQHGSPGESLHEGFSSLRRIAIKFFLKLSVRYSPLLEKKKKEKSGGRDGGGKNKRFAIGYAALTCSRTRVIYFSLKIGRRSK